MNRSLYQIIIRPTYIFILAIVLSGCFAQQVINFSDKPHPKQYLINRNYMLNLGLSNSIDILDMMGDERVKAIHLGTFDHPQLMNYMTFDTNGDIASVSRLNKDSSTLKLIDFKYDQSGKLIWIVPNKAYFLMLDYDNITINYKGSMPEYAVAAKDGNEVWVDEIEFDDNNGKYLFHRSLDDKQELFNLYTFKEGKIISEQYLNRTTNEHPSFVEYIYANDRLIEKNSILDSTSYINTRYDEYERPKTNIFKFNTTDSIAWQDDYHYILDYRIPYKIITTSSLGWKEEVELFWDQF